MSRRASFFRLEAEELYLGEGKPSASEAGFFLSQALTFSQHGLGLHPKTPLALFVPFESAFFRAEHLTADDGTLELAEICCQQSKRTHTQTEIPCQQSTWTQIQPEILSQQPTRTHTPAEIPLQQLAITQMQAEILSQQSKRTNAQGEIPCQQPLWMQKQPEIVAARCAAYRVFLRKTREGSWESTKLRFLFASNTTVAGGGWKKIDIRSIA